MKQLSHENIVRVLEDKCLDEAFHFYIMEFVDGGDFREAVLAQRLSQQEVLNIAIAAGDALHYAHAIKAELVHRDVKPSNILLTVDVRVRVTDFDLVRIADTTGGTRTGHGLGTFIYAAPESLAKASEIDVRADVFSLRMTTVFGLFGQELPLAAFKQTSEFIDSLNCSTGIKEVLTRAVSWEPSERFASMQAFTEAIRAALEDMSLGSRSVSPGSTAAPSSSDTNTVKVSYLLRRSKGIHQSANFEATIAHIEQSHDSTHSVVDDRMRVVGLIRYPLLSNVIFDTSVTQLIRAEDLATQVDTFLYPEDPLTDAYEHFQSETDDCIPVVTRDEPHELLGVIRRSDIMHAMITEHRNTK